MDNSTTAQLVNKWRETRQVALKSPVQSASNFFKLLNDNIIKLSVEADYELLREVMREKDGDELALKMYRALMFYEIFLFASDLVAGLGLDVIIFNISKWLIEDQDMDYNLVLRPNVSVPGTTSTKSQIIVVESMDYFFEFLMFSDLNSELLNEIRKHVLKQAKNIDSCQVFSKVDDQVFEFHTNHVAQNLLCGSRMVTLVEAMLSHRRIIKSWARELDGKFAECRRDFSPPKLTFLQKSTRFMSKNYLENLLLSKLLPLSCLENPNFYMVAKTLGSESETNVLAMEFASNLVGLYEHRKEWKSFMKSLRYSPRAEYITLLSFALSFGNSDLYMKLVGFLTELKPSFLHFTYFATELDFASADLKVGYWFENKPKLEKEVGFKCWFEPHETRYKLSKVLYTTDFTGTLLYTRKVWADNK